MFQGAKRISLSYNPNKPQTVKGILSHLDMERIEKGPKEVFNPEIQKEILVLEEQEVRLILGDDFNHHVFQILSIYNYIVIRTEKMFNDKNKHGLTKQTAKQDI